MAKRLFVPIIIILALAMLTASVLAQQTGIQQEAEEKRFQASELLGELNARDFESQDARNSLMQANDAFDQGMTFYENEAWLAAIDSFDDAIYLGGEAIIIEEDIDIGEITGLDLPWGDGMDLDGIGQGVHPADLPILIGFILMTVFIVLPVTYYFV